MKNYVITAIFLCAALLAGEPTSPIAEKPLTGSGSFISNVATYSTSYRRIIVGDWFQMDRGGDGQTVSVPGGIFAPAECTVTVSSEPVVTKRADGKWDITFPAKPPTIRWNNYRLSVGAWSPAEPYPSDQFVVGRDGSRKTHTDPGWSPDIEPSIEVGLRADGVLVWRDAAQK